MPRKSSRIGVGGSLCGLFIVVVGGCASRPTTTPVALISRPSPSSVKYSDVRPEDLIPPAPDDYRLRPGDVLQVTISDTVAPGVETTKRCRVSAAGTISLPLVPPILVAGLTEAQISDLVSRIYRDIE